MSSDIKVDIFDKEKESLHDEKLSRVEQADEKGLALKEGVIVVKDTVDHKKEEVRVVKDEVSYEDFLKSTMLSPLSLEERQKLLLFLGTKSEEIKKELELLKSRKKIPGYIIMPIGAVYSMDKVPGFVKVTEDSDNTVVSVKFD